MNTRKEQAIQETVSNFREMADLTLQQLSLIEKMMLSVPGKDQDDVTAEIIENEDKIDRLELVISENFINSIVLYQPLASDLRKLLAIYRMTINLERIGDLVLNIAQGLGSARDTAEYRLLAEVILNMFRSGRIMVEKSLLSFVNGDQDFAVWTIKNDDVVDEMNNKILADGIARAGIDRKTKSMLLSYIEIRNMISNIERIADHATNIAEASIYSAKGTDIRHAGKDKTSDTNEP